MVFSCEQILHEPCQCCGPTCESARVTASIFGLDAMTLGHPDRRAPCGHAEPEPVEALMGGPL